MHLVQPPVKKIDLHFPLGLEVSARNLKGVTVKDALDAIYKQFKKKVSLSWHFGSAVLTHAGGRRAGPALPRWLRVGQGRVLDALDRAPEEGAHRTAAQQQEVQKEEQG